MNQKQDFPEPPIKQAIAFFDGQNLYRHAKKAFGHHHPNYDPQKLHAAICKEKGWEPSAVRFYTGIPTSKHSPQWRRYWGNRLFAMECKGIHVTKRILQYHQEEVVPLGGTTFTSPEGEKFTFPDGANATFPDDSDANPPDSIKEVKEIPREKGIDVRLALDMVRLARQEKYDVAVLFSQDQDLAEAVKDVKEIAREQERWIKLVCAFPDGPNASIRRGIRGCKPFEMDEDFYGECLDPRDYRR